MAQDAAPAAKAQPTVSAPAAPAAATPAAAKDAGPGNPDEGGWVPMTPTPGKGMPKPAGIDVQQQYSPVGRMAYPFHVAMMWIMGIICVFVAALLLWVMIRYRAGRNPVPSKTTHNTMLEVVWTLLPVLILVGIAIPSIKLLAKQYESPPKDAITIKATGYQWYWDYTYPDNGVEVVSKMLNVPGEPEINAGTRYDGTKPWDGPNHLEVDNRLVVPVGVPLRIQTTGADVIHSFAVPSLWFKLDAIPGRLNERMLQIDEPGVYYGQCSELCGAKHGFMPIAIEAVPMDKWRQWVALQGGHMKKTGGSDASAQPADAAAAPEATPSDKPAEGAAPVAPVTPTPATTA
ncbi:cytochrome c oxidase subunit II [Porphyrobacter algicida]|uniref:Cytochrome c oxidase subunit 2 n=2 Tax=Qipengyuania algicida TaxID=1836209 RepID=A0A845AEJ8_9SPHN|nr:cytochrome c oxidase subunit II [Qipengyuania algicida]